MTTVPTPSVTEFLMPYKTWAKIRASKKEIPLTEAQHEIAHIFGFSDWQKFHYFFQQMSEVDIGLTRSEWFYLCEAHNGHMHSKSESARTMANDLCEADKYENLGQKWFGEQSVFDLENEETYEPSDAVRAFAIRVKNFTPEQHQAAVAAYHYFWGKPFPFEPQLNDEFQEMNAAFSLDQEKGWILNG